MANAPHHLARQLPAGLSEAGGLAGYSSHRSLLDRSLHRCPAPVNGDLDFNTVAFSLIRFHMCGKDLSFNLDRLRRIGFARRVRESALCKIILDRLRQVTLARRVRESDPCRIIVGAGSSRYDGWIATEINVLNLLRPNDWARFFGERKIDAILAEHVWEHLTPEESEIAARTCYRYLKPGGYLRVAVPDANNPTPEYIEYVRPGGSGPDAEDHKCLYNYRTLKELFEAVGFQVCLLEFFDEDGILHFKDWDPEDGMIRRSKRFDRRNSDGVLCYTSIILDAYKEVPLKERRQG